MKEKLAVWRRRYSTRLLPIELVTYREFMKQFRNLASEVPLKYRSPSSLCNRDKFCITLYSLRSDCTGLDIRRQKYSMSFSRK